MAEWNAYYRNDDEEEEQEEGDQSGGEVKAITFHHHRLWVGFIRLFNSSTPHSSLNGKIYMITLASCKHDQIKVQ